jgi:hypothetical protein
VKALSWQIATKTKIMVENAAIARTFISACKNGLQEAK